MENICILTTGGTLDKHHDPVSKGIVFSNRSFVPDILKECRGPELKHEVLMIKDSLDMADEDRELILSAVQRRPENKILITHGTSTMVKTADFLVGKAPDKTIVFTGALRPYSLHHSDASFNLGTSLAALQTLEQGVYIAMNGRVFAAGTVKKNEATGFFEEI